MFSGIDSRCVPRAQVRVRFGGRSGSANQPSTPAVNACAHRNFGMLGSNPGEAPADSIASVLANWSADGLSRRGRVSIATRASNPATAMASI